MKRLLRTLAVAAIVAAPHFASADDNPFKISPDLDARSASAFTTSTTWTSTKPKRSSWP